MKFLKVFFFLFFAVLTGLGIGVMRIASIEKSKVFFRNGSWQAGQVLISEEDKLSTAQISAFALFALPNTEAVYFFSRRDNKNELLNGENDYVITGNIHQIKAIYWSVTAYGKDLFLIPNQQNKYSFHSANLQTDSAGNFTIYISPSEKSGNWLPVLNSQRFDLVLRVYKGEKEFMENLKTTPLPTIKKAEKI